jgi:hypothetical protein
MPAESQKQQRFFGYLYAHPEEAEKRGINMTHEQIRDFAATPRKGLPVQAKPDHYGIRKK